MSKITLDAVVYEGAPFVYNTAEDNRPTGPPTDELGALLDSLGFRQFTVYDHRYDTRLVLDSPSHNGRTLALPRGGRGNLVQPGSTIVYDGETMTALAVLEGDRTEKKAKPRKKAAGSGKSKAAVTPADDDEFVRAPGDYRWR